MNKIKKKLIGTLTGKSLLYITGIACSLCYLLNTILTPFIQSSEEYQNANQAVFDKSPLMFVLTVCLFSPLFEEFIFRGTIYEMFKLFINFIGRLIKVNLRVVAMVIAVGFSGFTFGYSHSNMIQFVYGFVFTLFLCNCYETHKTLLAPIWMHIAANTFSLLTNFVPSEVQEKLGIVFLLAASIVLAKSCANLRKLVKENDKFEEIVDKQLTE